jgi:hypothetical protein
MNLDTFIYEIKLNYNIRKLISEGEEIGYTSGYELGGRKRRTFETLLEARIDDLDNLKKYEEINNVYIQIKNIFNRDIHSITYYKLLIGSGIGAHKDPFTEKNRVGVAINILLSEDRHAPLKFIIEDKHYDIFYNSVLFNANNVMHYVPKQPTQERILIRYFVKDMTLEEGKNIILAREHLDRLLIK